MDTAIIDAVVLAAYLTLLLELWLIPVPSVASARSLATAAEREPATVPVFLRKMRWYLPVTLNIAAFFLPLIAALGVLFPGWAATSAYADPAPAVVGILAVFAGRSITVFSALALRSQVRLTLAEGTLEPPLHTSGVFSLSRNPGLLGMYLFAIGLLVLKPSVWFALGLLHYVWHMHRRVLMEEGHLTRAFGAAYNDYMARTRRYV